MTLREGPIRVDEDATRDLVARAAAISREHEPAVAARHLAHLAGARVRQDHVEFGVWLPDLADAPGEEARDEAPDGRRAAPSVELELLTLDAPPEEDAQAPSMGTDAAAGPADPRARPAAEGRHPARRQRLPMVREGAWAWLACRGATLGTRERLGSLYRVVVAGPDGEEVRGDPLAASLPFGGHGPAELYDVPRMHQGRHDVDYFRRIGLAGEEDLDPPRLAPPAHLLQVHVGTATHGGTLADLTDLYRALAEKVRAGESPTAGEACFLGHDALQLLPLEPVAVDPAAPARFEVEGDGDVVMLTLRPPRAANWGYDGLLHGAAALEPALTRSGRPDELVDLAAVLHTFPGKPIRLVLDLVFGHAHEQGRALLPAPFLADEGPYGPRPALADPTVRALLLEAQRRKLDYGVDGVRIDAAHEVEAAEADRPHDEGERFLDALAGTEACVAEIRYRPFTIYEHARPREGVPGPPTFRAVADRREDALQWGPLSFHRADPQLAGWWGSVWWRLEETAAHGSRWITGHADHDTMRSAATTSLRLPVAWRLGPDRPSVMRRAFDLPAASLLTYGLLPGVPQTFLAASLRAPWAFFRDAGARDVPAAASEAAALAWRFTEADYAEEGAFPRLKALGLRDHGAAVAYFAAAAEAPDAATAAGAPAAGGVPSEAARPEEAARALMGDLREACVAWNGERWLDPAWVGAARTLRRARADRPWLARDLHARDRLERRVRPDGSLAVVGVRHAPDGGESVALLANLSGEPWAVTPAEALGDADWGLLVASPATAWQGAETALTLADGEGVLLCRDP